LALLAGTVNLYSQTPLDCVDNGNAAIQIGDYAKAIELYSLAVEIDPRYAPAYFLRGVAKSRLKDGAGAIDDFTKAIEIDPGDHISYYTRGVEKGIIKDFSGAIADYTKATELEPDYARAWFSGIAWAGI
jgi:tetratricopeptide (TPR) repeat protein